MAIDLQGIIDATTECKGQRIGFSQSQITQKYKERHEELHPGGICLALSMFYLSKKSGNTFQDLVPEVYFKKIEEATNEPSFRAQVKSIMGRQADIKTGLSGTEQKNIIETFVPFVEWMKELAPNYGLELNECHTGERLNPGSIASSILRSAGKSVILGLGGADRGHAMAARMDRNKVAFFDPNTGSYAIPTDCFAEWYLSYMFLSQYQTDYGNTFTLAVFA